MKIERRMHSRECKPGAVALVVEQGHSCAEAGRSLGVNGALIALWERQLEDDASGAFPGKVKPTSEQLRIHELETEIQRLRGGERNPKKTTAFFVRKCS